MQLREFTDSQGTHWRVWDIRQERLDPGAGAESQPQGFVDGWLVFESVATGEKVRMYPLPEGWQLCTDRELAELKELAARPDRLGVSGLSARGATAGTVRTFSYPGGASWTAREVAVVHCSTDGARTVHTVLRFSSGRRSLDMHAWPSGWGDFSDQELADLLWRAFPRGTDGENVTPFRRRRSDPGGLWDRAMQRNP